LRLLDSYDIPKDVADGPHSPVFAKFLWNWFGNPMALSRGELDLTFLNDLTQGELSLARELIRRNLPVKHTSIFQGVEALRDVEAAPILRRMLSEETELTWRLTISGALWRLNRDPVFITCLEEAKSIRPGIFKGVHLWQVLWLDDERAVDFLIDLVDQGDWPAQSMTLGLLNQLEFGRPMGIPAKKMPHQPADYRKLRGDPAFRAHMVAAIHKLNAERKNGV
jgi:hypothetical protein